MSKPAARSATKIKPMDPAQGMRRLRHAISVVRGQWRTELLLRMGGFFAAIFCGYFAAEMLLDWIFNLPWLLRFLFLLGLLGGAGWLAWRNLIRPLKEPPNDDKTALMIERALPLFRSRFIASIQLARLPGAAESTIVGALLAETNSLAQHQNFRNVVRKEQVKKQWKRTGLAVLALAIVFAVGQADAISLFRRALLSFEAVPRKTKILNLPGDATLALGDNFELGAQAAGVIPSAGRAILTFASGRKQEFALSKLEGNRFGATIQNVQEPFKYQVRLNDAVSDTFAVTLVPRPTVKEIRVRVHYPEYTGASAEDRSIGDLALLPGSKLEVNATANMPLQEGGAWLVGAEQFVSGAVDAKDPQRFRVELPVSEGITGFKMEMRSQQGGRSNESAVYRIDIAKDAPPQVKIVFPVQTEVLATAKAKVPIAFEGADDFGIRKIIIHYEIKKGDEVVAPEKTVEIDLGENLPRKLQQRYEWRMDALDPAVQTGQSVEFWLEAVDGNSVTGPGMAKSARHSIRIVSEEEKLGDLRNWMNQYFDTINEVKDQQQKTNEELGKTIKEGSGVVQ